MTTTKLVGITSLTNQLTTELNSLANGSAAIASTGYDNSTNLAIAAALELNVTFGSSPTAGSLITGYFVPALDGTNYDDATTGASPLISPDLYKFYFWLRAVTSAQKVAAQGAGPNGQILLPPNKFKVYVINNSGQAFPASGSTISMETFALQTV